MAKSNLPWNGMVQPDHRYGTAYRVISQIAYPAIKEIIEQIVASGLIYMNSHAVDFKVPELRKYLDKYLRGTGGISADQRVKTMKLLWDTIGSEFGARHELYEINYLGSNDITRLCNLWDAQATGDLDEMKRFADTCMAEYNLDGWIAPDMISSDDVNVITRG
jgi:4-hydroxyphenylacetate 3-monooxygenase